MNSTRKGKIARLPLAIREELNRRMQDGEQGKDLVKWLNAVPEVLTVLLVGFGSRPVREQNLSEWRQGGYRDWLEQQEALEATERLSEQAVQAEHGGGPALTDTLARWVAARYAVAARRVAETEGPEGWRMLREMCGDVVELRRGDHSAQRLDLESARVSVAKEDAQVRWRRKLIYGLETLMECAEKNPETKAAYEVLAKMIWHPADGGPNPHRP